MIGLVLLVLAVVVINLILEGDAYGLVDAFVLTAAGCLLLLVLSGCAAAPPAERVPTACQPLPACDIPTGSNSTQLEEALWKCVMEYRALYSVCYHIAKQDEADASR